ALAVDSHVQRSGELAWAIAFLANSRRRLTGGRELLDEVAGEIGDVEVALAVDRDTARRLQILDYARTDQHLPRGIGDDDRGRAGGGVTLMATVCWHVDLYLGGVGLAASVAARRTSDRMESTSSAVIFSARPARAKWVASGSKSNAIRYSLTTKSRSCVSLST